MDFIESDYFYYKNGVFYCEQVPVEDIIKVTGTPVYIYSRGHFVDSYQRFTNAFREINPQVYYAVKSNFNISVIKTFSDLGAGADVNSEGEYYRALKAGVPSEKMILTGVGKSDKEIELGIKNNFLMIKAESEEELMVINDIAGSLNSKARVALRVNPDVDAGTHPYISTGLMENKFGINMHDAYDLFCSHKSYKNILFTGIDMHIGSQINRVEPFVEAVEKISELWFRLKEKKIPLKHFDMGGGIGIQYNDETVISLKELAARLIPLLKELECEVLFEPGRFLTGNGGILAASVLFTKSSNDKNFIVTDAAMNDLIRPSIYNAYHHIQPVRRKKSAKDIVADIVGPVCESGDFFAKGRIISELKRGDVAAIMSAGAYGMVMSSNYNGRRRPVEIMVDKNGFRTIRSRETFPHLMYDEENLLYLTSESK